MGLIELSDLVVGLDGAGPPVPVRRAELVGRLRAMGDRRAARIAARLPVLDDDVIDADRVLVAAHCEIQRLSEEFRHGDRMAELLDPLLAAIRAGSAVSPPGRLRVVDVGCGTGYVLRAMAAMRRWDDVDLVGVDFNPALVAEAERLAAAEGLGSAVSFRCADAFALPEPGHVFISTGVLHHFPLDALPAFFAAHEDAGVLGFAHVDFQPSAMSALGAWIFHRTRMRLPVARLDGVRSARRARPPGVVAAAARQGAPSFALGVYGRCLRTVPAPRPLATVVGVRAALADDFVHRLGGRAWRWEPVG